MRIVMPKKRTILKYGFDAISAAIICAWIGFVFWSLRSSLDDQALMSVENGLIETMQAVLLAISCIFYLTAAALKEKPGKLIFLFCSLFCYSFVLRELDVEKFDIPYPLIFIGSGAGRNVTIAVAFIAILACAALRNFRFYEKAAKGFIKSRPGMLLIAGGVFLFIGEFFEKYDAIVNHVYWEEISELFAYVLILVSSLAALFSVISAPVPPIGLDKVSR
jgi:hypothetical protein